MTDYKEEQQYEIDALESIYPSELTIVSRDPEDSSFIINIKTEFNKNDPEQYMATSLKFAYVPNYPDEVPLIEMEDSENFSPEDEEDMLAFLFAKAEENLGMVMVYTLVSEATEWLNERLTNNVVRNKREEEERILKQEEEERTRFEGVRVTVESFLTWKAKFDIEISELKLMQQKSETAIKKLTGRELFEKDQTLVDSDLKFLDEGDDVKVDESLFQELEDLDLEEEVAS